MSRLSTLRPEDATGPAADLFAKIRKAVGKVPNAYATIGTHSPATLGAALTNDAVLAGGKLKGADVEVVKLVVSQLVGCDYCLGAHTMIGRMQGLSDDAMKQVRAGIPSGDARRDALARFVRVLTTTQGTVAKEEVDAVRAAGFSEQEIIETLFAISTITFTNLVNRVNDTTLDFPAAP